MPGNARMWETCRGTHCSLFARPHRPSLVHKGFHKPTQRSSDLAQPLDVLYLHEVAHRISERDSTTRASQDIHRLVPKMVTTTRKKTV